MCHLAEPVIRLTLIETKPFTTAGKIDTDDLGFKINIGQDGKGNYTDGGSAEIVDAMIDDVGIWRRVLTPQEVAAIYNAGSAGQDLSLAGAAPSGLGKVIAGLNGNTLTLTWTAGATVRLQKATNLSPANWQDVAGTVGQGSATDQVTSGAAFYRLVRP